MSFTHPLAKKAKMWPLRSRDGSERRVLIVVTTVELDPESEKFKKKQVDRLSDAVSLYLEADGDVAEFILVNCTRDWGA